MSIQKLRFTVLALTAVVSGAAHAALHDRGGGLIYDDDLNVTWLSDSGYAMTSGYDSDGRMTWEEASRWAADLVYGGYDDWRLPSLVYERGGYISSELQYLYRSLLGPAIQQGGLNTLATNHNSSYDLFDVHPTWFWINNPTTQGWEPRYPAINMFDGFQSDADRGDQLMVWAVRDGDVAAVPEPGVWAMLLAGVAMVGVTVTRSKMRSMG